LPSLLLSLWLLRLRCGCGAVAVAVAVVPEIGPGFSPDIKPGHEMEGVHQIV
jgi:hypothetical protein